jgi:hypothetical protein
VLAACFSTSCKHESNPIQPLETAPDEFRNSTFPLAIGNQWAYVDSFFNEPIGPILTTMEITAYAAGWWNIDESPGGSFGLKSRNDTILYVGPDESSPTVKYIPNPSMGDTIVIKCSSYGSPYPVRVYSLAHSVTTPAGTFDSCAAYEWYLTPRVKYVNYFRPRTGLIAWETYITYEGEDTLRIYQRAKLVFVKLTR